MSAPKFTPGPWHVNGKQSVRGPAGEYIARANLQNGPANARLVAAAPELYEAAIGSAASLAAAISLLEGGGKKAAPSDRMFDQMLVDYRRALEAARAALAKARGEA